MGKEVCQLDIFTRPSWGRELTYEVITISIPNHNLSYIQWCLIFFQCMEEYRRENIKDLFA